MSIDEAMDFVDDILSTVSWNEEQKDQEEFFNNVSDWLEELKVIKGLKAIKELNLEIPQHFTKEQSGYCNWKSNYEIMKEGNIVFDIQCREDNGLKRGSVPNNFAYGSFKYCPFCGRKIKWL